jgi:two-component system, NtrC family, sensor kinase
MKIGFRKKIYLGFFALLLIQGLIMFFWVSQVMRDSLLEEIKSHGHSIGVSLSARMIEPMLAMDFLRMKVLMDETVELDHDIFYTFILDTQGRPLIHTFKGGFPIALKKVNTVSDNQKGSMQLLDTGNYLIYDYAIPIFINANRHAILKSETLRLGTLRLGLFQKRAQKVANKIIIWAIVTIILSILLAGVVGTLLLNPVTKKIKKLHESSEKALRGNLDIKTAPGLKQNCWNIMQCDRKECPAYENFHHRCWYMAGTLCPSCVHGAYAKKIDSCHQCRVYKQCSGDEIQSLAESFDAMTLSLNDNFYDLKSAETVLNEQKALLQTILDAIPDFISLQDHKGQFISVNKAFCKMLNKDKEQVVGKLNEELFHEKFIKIYNKEDRHILETGIALVKENKIVVSKEVKWLHIVKIRVPAAKAMDRGLVCSGRDITQLKNVQEQLTHAQKMESVGRLAAGVAHEINTPLGVILGYAQLLLEDVKNDEQVFKDVQTIVRQTKNCSKIVADLLKFSRSSKSVITRFDINDAIKEVIEVVEHTFRLNQVIVKHEYDKNQDLNMEGDKEKIKQVFINLLNNALDAVKGNGNILVETTPVKALSGDKSKEIQISISDTGCGVTPEDLDKLFEPFYTTKGPDKGTGLGLSVTFGIIKEHNGSIKAFSPSISGKNKDRGTQFIIALPCDLHYT